MVNFMIFVIFMYVLYKTGILKTLVSFLSTAVILLASYFVILKPLFERFEDLKFYLFVAVGVLIGVAYIFTQMSTFASNFKDKDQKDKD